MKAKTGYIFSFLLMVFFPLNLFSSDDPEYSTILKSLDAKYSSLEEQCLLLFRSDAGQLISKQQSVLSLKEYLSKLPDPEKNAAMEMILQKEYFLSHKNENPVNYPLLILLSLCERKQFRNGDDITFALSLANSYIFSFADRETKVAILQDCEKHFQLYRDIVVWQKKEVGSNFSLDRAPLIPKILWSTRSDFFSYLGVYLWKHQELEKKLTLDTYREYVDDIGVLSEIHSMIKADHLYSKNIRITASSIEDFVHAHRFYGGVWWYKHLGRSLKDRDYQKALKYSKEIIKVPGGEYSWTEMFWINGQYRRCYRKYGEFVAMCDVTTMIQNAFYRASGIAPLTGHWISRSWKPYLSHCAPSHYDTVNQRWRFYQSPDYSDISVKDQDEINDMYYQFLKPVWHPWLKEKFIDIHNSSHFQGEKTYSGQLISFLKMGMDENTFEKIFLSDGTMKKGLLFSEKTAPVPLADSDQDHLPDALENAVRSNPSKIDSDDDGASDLYEYDTGTDPGSPASKGDAFIFIDGFKLEKNYSGFAQIGDLTGDSKGNADIDKVWMTMRDDYCYLAVDFTVKKGTKPERCFINIDNRGDDKPEVNIGLNQGTHGDFSRFKEDYQTYDFSGLTRKENCDAYMAESAEFKISPEVLGAKRVNLFVGFWGEKGLVDGLSIPVSMQLGEKAKYLDSDHDGASDAYEYMHGTDYLSSASRPEGTILIDGLKEDWNKLNAQEFQDPAGDETGAIDIRKVSLYSEEGYLYVLVNFKQKNDSMPERCFINIDNKGDSRPEINIGLNPDSQGDFARFKENYETYDHVPLKDKKGCEAFIADVAEFKLSPEVLGGSKVNLYIGFWGQKGSIDGINVGNVTVK